MGFARNSHQASNGEVTPLSGDITGVRDLLTALGDRSFFSEAHAHVRYLFRGHADAAWKLEPGVYRPSFKFARQSGEDDEDARLRTEQHLAQDFRVMSAGLRSGREDNVNLYFLQQHYGMPTRLLDWSNNPLAALYFSAFDKDKDGFDATLFALDAYRLASEQGAPPRDKVDPEHDVNGIATSDRYYLRSAIEVIAQWQKKDAFGEYVLALRPDHFDKRISLQRSAFTFHVPARPRLAKLECVREFFIPRGAKSAIREELALLGIDDFSVYGDLDHLARRLKGAYLKRSPNGLDFP